MKGLPPAWRWISVCLCAAAAISMAAYFYDLAGQMGGYFKADARRTLGKSEAEARQIMKVAPKYVLTPEEVGANGINAPWAGMNFVPIPTHPVHKRVLLYQHGWLAAYIFIDNDGKVEDVELAST